MKIAISQSNYIPWKGYFDMINSVDVFVIYDEVQYTKNDWRNRNVLKTKNGLEWLTIPVKQKTISQSIDETEIAKHNWNVKHWKTIKAVYGKALYFKKYESYFENLFLNTENILLSEINYKFITAICEILNIKTKIINSRSLDLQGDKNQRLIEANLKLNSTVYISGPAAKSYLDKDLFLQNNIKVEWMDYSEYKEYKQMHEPFEHGVSVLDLIFNKGEDACQFLKSFS